MSAQGSVRLPKIAYSIAVAADTSLGSNGASGLMSFRANSSATKKICPTSITARKYQYNGSGSPQILYLYFDFLAGNSGSIQGLTGPNSPNPPFLPTPGPPTWNAPIGAPWSQAEIETDGVIITPGSGARVVKKFFVPAQQTITVDLTTIFSPTGLWLAPGQILTISAPGASGSSADALSLIEWAWEEHGLLWTR